MRKLRNTAPLVATILLATGLVACEQQGPLEKAGEQLDEAVDKVGDAVDQQGPLERAGEKVDEAVQSVGEQTSRSLRRAGEQIERATNG